MPDANTPVPSFSDEEIEALIADYLKRKLLPIAEVAKCYCALRADMTCSPDAACAGPKTRFEWSCYTATTNHQSARELTVALQRTQEALRSVDSAARLRAEAAEKIAAAERIEAAAAQLASSTAQKGAADDLRT